MHDSQRRLFSVPRYERQTTRGRYVMRATTHGVFMCVYVYPVLEAPSDVRLLTFAQSFARRAIRCEKRSNPFALSRGSTITQSVASWQKS